MWETLLLQVMKNIVVPELASFIRKKFEDTGTWPTEEELKAKAYSLANSIIHEGNDFLNRPVIEGRNNVKG